MKWILLTAWFVVISFWMFGYFYRENEKRDLEWKRKRDAERKAASS